MTAFNPPEDKVPIGKAISGTVYLFSTMNLHPLNPAVQACWWQAGKAWHWGICRPTPR